MDVPHLVHAAGRALRRLSRSPAVHYAVVGALLFAAVSQRRAQPPGADERPRLVVPAARLALARQELPSSHGGPAATHEEVVRFVVDQEVLYRHALALGLAEQPVVERRLAQIASFVADEPHAPRTAAQRAAEAVDLGLHHGDLVVRRILIDAAKRLIRAAVLSREPTAAALEAYLREHPEEFQTPGEIRLSHVELDPSRPLTATSPPAAVPPSLPPLPERELERRFGYRFVKRLAELPTGSWQGPVASRYGLHLLYVHERIAPRVAELAEVRKEVRARLREELADAWLETRLQQLRAEYEIVVEEGNTL